jgi:hypothetical protein
MYQNTRPSLSASDFMSWEISKLSTDNAIMKAQLAQQSCSKAPPYTNFYQLKDIGKRALDSMGNTHIHFPFGAVAELIDNAREAAKMSERSDIHPPTMSIELEMGGRGISFTDTGRGMDVNIVYSMIESGNDMKGKNYFGDGFKSSIMGLGEEALILTNDGHNRGMVFLSHTTNAVISTSETRLCVPIAFWHPDGSPATKEHPICSSIEQSRPCDFQDVRSTESVEREVLRHVYDSKGSAVINFSALRNEFCKIAKGGTRILIWRLHHQWTLEGDDDILIPRNETGVLNFSRDTRISQGLDHCDTPCDYSLRCFCQMLYLDPSASGIRIFINGEEVVFKDPLSGIFVSHIRECPVILRNAGNPSLPVALRLTLAYSPEDSREGRRGCHIYWRDTQSELWRRLNLSPRLIHPYFRLGTYDETGAMSGAVGRLVLTPDAFKLHPSKQALNEHSGGHNWRVLEKALFHAYWDYADVMEAARVQCPLRRLLDRGLMVHGMCWGLFDDGMWYPACLLNRYDPLEQLNPTLRSASEYHALEGGKHEMCIIRWLDEGAWGIEFREHGIVHYNNVRPWGLECPDGPARRGCSDSVVAEAQRRHEEVFGEELENCFRCMRCGKARRVRTADQIPGEARWTCDLGFGRGQERGCHVPEAAEDRIEMESVDAENRDFAACGGGGRGAFVKIEPMIEAGAESSPVADWHRPALKGPLKFDPDGSFASQETVTDGRARGYGEDRKDSPRAPPSAWPCEAAGGGGRARRSMRDSLRVLSSSGSASPPSSVSPPSSPSTSLLSPASSALSVSRSSSSASSTASLLSLARSASRSQSPASPSEPPVVSPPAVFPLASVSSSRPAPALPPDAAKLPPGQPVAEALRDQAPHSPPGHEDSARQRARGAPPRPKRTKRFLQCEAKHTAARRTCKGWPPARAWVHLGTRGACWLRRRWLWSRRRLFRFLLPQRPSQSVRGFR